jgi:hypothetical protein
MAHGVSTRISQKEKQTTWWTPFLPHFPSFLPIAFFLAFFCVDPDSQKEMQASNDLVDHLPSSLSFLPTFLSPSSLFYSFLPLPPSPPFSLPSILPPSLPSRWTDFWEESTETQWTLRTIASVQVGSVLSFGALVYTLISLPYYSGEQVAFEFITYASPAFGTLGLVFLMSRLPVSVKMCLGCVVFLVVPLVVGTLGALPHVTALLDAAAATGEDEGTEFALTVLMYFD